MKLTLGLSRLSEKQPRSYEVETGWRDSPKGAFRLGFPSSAVAYRLPVPWSARQDVESLGEIEAHGRRHLRAARRLPGVWFVRSALPAGGELRFERFTALGTDPWLDRNSRACAGLAELTKNLERRVTVLVVE